MYTVPTFTDIGELLRESDPPAPGEYLGRPHRYEHLHQHRAAELVRAAGIRLAVRQQAAEAEEGVGDVLGGGLPKISQKLIVFVFLRSKTFTCISRCV